jgi:Heme oxygenase
LLKAKLTGGHGYHDIRHISAPVDNIVMSPIIDSQPLAALLRESTQNIHGTAESSPGAIALLSGRLRKEEYVRYLMMLWYIYE